jgi:hypothetical protein
MVTASIKKAIESLYTGTCTVTEYLESTNAISKITKHIESNVLTNQPCRLSFQSINSTNPTDTVATVAQSTKLFISPDVVIKDGSKITVIQNGVTGVFKSSGEPAKYSSHQEIMLTLFDGWA